MTFNRESIPSSSKNFLKFCVKKLIMINFSNKNNACFIIYLYFIVVLLLKKIINKRDKRQLFYIKINFFYMLEVD